MMTYIPLLKTTNWGLAIVYLGLTACGALAQPPNDDFANRAELTNVETPFPSSNVEATAEMGEPDHAGNLAVASVWWSWAPTNSFRVEIDTLGSDFDTVLAVYTGNSLTTLVEVASNDDANGAFQSRVRFEAMVGSTYQIVVAGVDGKKGAILLNLGDAPPAPDNDDFDNPTIITNFLDAVVSSSMGASSEVSEPSHAESPATASVWWSWTPTNSFRVEIDTLGSDFDTVLAVYTGNNLTTLTPVAMNDDATDVFQSRVRFNAIVGSTYQIAIDGIEGEEGAINLNLRGAPPAPDNDDFDNRIVLTGFSTSFMGTNVGANREPGEPDHNGRPSSNSVWWTWTAPVDGNAVIDTFDSSFDTILAVYTGTEFVTLVDVASNDDTGSPQSQVEFLAIDGATYQIVVVGSDESEGSIELHIALPLPPTPQIATFHFNPPSSADITWDSEIGVAYGVMESTDLVVWTQRVQIEAVSTSSTVAVDLSLHDSDAFRIDLIFGP